MQRAIISISVVLLLAGAWSGVAAQKVYRCQLADGSTVFSDLPCLSEVGRADTVDATPHQGHRPAPEPGTRAYQMPDSERGGRRVKRSGRDSHRTLSRDERLSLERKRKNLLSGLKRRNVDSGKKKSMIRQLRSVDRRLGIDAGDVADMPYHNREVYEAYPVFR